MNTFQDNSSLGRVLLGTALPEDTLMARCQFSSGVTRLSRDPIGRFQADSLMRMARGSTLAEDLVNGRRAINDILRPLG
jgi:hypothetical protein